LLALRSGGARSVSDSAQDGGGQQPRAQRGSLPHLLPSLGDEVAREGLPLPPPPRRVGGVGGRRRPRPPRRQRPGRGGAMAACARWLARGMPVMLFPEGTRSKVGQLLPFKDGAFRLAIETGAELLPLAVAGTGTALPKHSWKFGRAQGRVTVGTPIPTA